MLHALRPPLPAIILVLTGFSVFSLSDAIVKSLSQHYDTFTLAFYIGLGVVLMVLAASPFMGGIKPVLTTPDRKWHILRGICLAIEFYLLIYGFSVMSMAKTYALLFAAPIITVLLASLLLRERAGPGQIAAVIAGFAGVLIILRPGMIPIDMASAGVILAAALYAFSNIVIRWMKEEKQPALSWPFYSELMIMLGAVPFFAMNPVLPAPEHMLGLAAISALSVIGMMTLGMAFRLGPTSTIAPFHYVQMIWAVLLGYALFGDVPDMWMMGGALVIILSGIALIRLAQPPVRAA